MNPEEQQMYEAVLKKIEKCRRTKAKALDLSDLWLTTLPPELCGLGTLETLTLNRNKLRAIPQELCFLTRLTELALAENDLIALPRELGQMTALTWLTLAGNRLTSVPSEIGELRALTWLDLGRNNLPEVPAELGQLGALKTLFLDHNKLTNVPADLGKLRALEQLNLSGNELTSLPSSLGDLARLVELFLHENPELGLPPELLGPTWLECRKGETRTKPRAILDYYFETRGTHGQALREAKLIFVGRGEVGKSSMVDALQGKPFVKGRPRTDGVAITTWPLDLPDGEAKVLMWDFGGQEIMHGTHQFFLTHRSLYVVMVDGRDDRAKQNAEYWLKLVRAFGGESTVMIVMNRQRAHPFDLDRQYLADKYGVKLEHFFRTDCERPGDIAPLRAAIEEEAARMLSVEERFPKKCWEVKAWLGEMKTKGKDYLSDEEYAAICEQRGVADGGEQQKLLRRLADLGTVVSFPEDVKLAALSVLNPEWATDGIYRVVTNEALREQRHGRLARRALRDLLPLDRWPQEKHVQYMLDLMEKFELCFAVAEGDGAVLVPELLPDKTPPLADWDAARCVVFLYEYPVLPHGVLPRFTTRTHALSEGRERWRSGVVLADDGAEALIKADYDANLVSVWVRGSHADARRALLKVVRHHFEHIHARIKNLQPRELVSVPEHPEVTVPYRDLVLDERAGVRTTRVTIDGARVEMEIALLLNGVESPAERAGTGERLERAPIYVQGNYIEHVTTDDHSSHITARDITNSQVGQTLTDCQVMVQQQPAGAQKELLTTLTNDVDQLVKQLPAAKADEAHQVAENLELLVKQATSAKPNRKWYDVSSEGLLEASKWVKDFTGNITGTVGQLGKLLFPGYELPGVEKEKESGTEKEKKKIG